MSARVLSSAGLAVLVALAALAPSGLAAEGSDAAWQTASLMPKPPRVGKPKKTAKPAPKATPKPQAKASPKPTARPTAAPAASPTPAPVASPSVSPVLGSDATSGAWVAESAIGTWVLPLGGAAGYDFSFNRPTLWADGSVWWGNLGLGASATIFNTVYAAFKTTPYFQANTWMLDALIKYRFDHGYYQVFGGYRGIGLADLNFATAGVGLNRPIHSDWLYLDGRAQYGNSFSGSYVVDLQLGLSAFLDPLTLSLGFRHMAMEAGNQPLFQINGPTAGVGLRF